MSCSVWLVSLEICGDGCKRIASPNPLDAVIHILDREKEKGCKKEMVLEHFYVGESLASWH
jgi:hypothetical protein